MSFRFVRLAVLAVAVGSAGYTVGAFAQATPLRIVARYDLIITLDASRNSAAVAKVKAVRGAMSLLGGSVPAGSIEDVVNISDTGYSVTSSGKANRILGAVLGGDTLSRRSEGAVTGGGYPASQKFSESRGSKTRLAVNTDYSKKISIYFKNGTETKREAVNYRIADSASMPYLFLRQPLPAAPFTIAATDGKSTRQIFMKPSDEVVQIGKTQVAAVRLTRDQKQGDDATLDLWLRKEDGMPLRMRVGLDEKYGVVLEQQLRELPSVMK